MMDTFRKPLVCLAFVALVVSLQRADAADVPNDPAAVEHALNRLTYGPREGDVERVRATGLATWIDRQLNPASLDDSALIQRLPVAPKPPDIGSQKEARQFARQMVQHLAASKLQRAIH